MSDPSGIDTQLFNLPLRPFIFDPHHIDPVGIAQQNEQEFQGNHRWRSTLEFLVRWTGYDMSSNSWEQYKALMHVDKLHSYFRQYMTQSLISKEHK